MALVCIKFGSQLVLPLPIPTKLQVLVMAHRGIRKYTSINMGGSGWTFFSNERSTLSILEIDLYDDVFEKENREIGQDSSSTPRFY